MVRLRWARALRAKVQGTSSKACAERCRGIEQSAFGADAKREEASAKFEEASSKFEEASSKACAELAEASKGRRIRFTGSERAPARSLSLPNV